MLLALFHLSWTCNGYYWMTFWNVICQTGYLSCQKNMLLLMLSNLWVAPKSVKNFSKELKENLIKTFFGSKLEFPKNNE